jgi:hypothetical protein
VDKLLVAHQDDLRRTAGFGWRNTDGVHSIRNLARAEESENRGGVIVLPDINLPRPARMSLIRSPTSCHVSLLVLRSVSVPQRHDTCVGLQISLRKLDLLIEAGGHRPGGEMRHCAVQWTKQSEGRDRAAFLAWRSSSARDLGAAWYRKALTKKKVQITLQITVIYVSKS